MAIDVAAEERWLVRLQKQVEDALRAHPGQTPTITSSEARLKILEGAKVVGSNDMVGGHSARLLNKHGYHVQIISENADGTISVKWIKELPNGEVSNIKPSTLAPRTWSDEMIIDAVNQVGNMPARQADLRGSSHVGTVNGVEWQVIKDPDGNVISAFPTGGKPPLPLTGK